MRRCRVLFVTGVVMAAYLCGCQKSPDSSIVVNKDFDNMIEQAENTQEEEPDISELAGDYDTYQTTFSDESLGVTVNVDAKVDIPETSQMSILRVGRAEFDQNFLDKVRETLSSGVTYYDGSAFSTRTKSDIEQAIQFQKELIAEVEANDMYNEFEDSRTSLIAEYQQGIDEFQEQYENAPDAINIEDYPANNQLQSVSERYNSNPDDEYYRWQYQLNPNGEVYCGVGNAKDGTALVFQRRIVKMMEIK